MMLIARGGYIDVDLYSEIKSTRKVKWHHVWSQTNYGHRESFVSVDDGVGKCIDLWFKNRDYAGLTLHEFLDKCVDDDGNLSNIGQ